jgi:predicted ATP-dependent protease
LTRKFLALALSISILAPSPLLAAGVTLSEGSLNVRQTAPVMPTVGVISLGTVNVPLTVPMSLSAVDAVPTLAQTAEIPQAAMPSMQIAVPGGAVSARPVIDIINQMQAKGITMPTTLSNQRDASQWIAAAEVLPEGSAKQNILSMAAAAAAGPAGNGMGPGLDKTYDGSEGSGSTAKAAPTVWDRLASFPLLPSGLRKRIQARADQNKPKPQLMEVESLAVPLDKARYTPDLNSLPASTREVQRGVQQIVGQDKALKSIRAGLEMTGPNYNLYISGPDGAGKETALRHILDELAPKMPGSADLVTVTNFGNPDMPIPLKLDQGNALKLASAVKEFVRTYQMALPQALDSEQAKELKKAISVELNKSAAERQAKFDESAGKERIGAFGIKIIPEDAGDGEHYNFNVALTYEDPADKTMKTVSSDKDFAKLVMDGVIKESDWEAAVRQAKSAAEPYMDDYRSMLAQNQAEKMVAYKQMYQQIAGMLVQEIGTKVMAAVAPNRHDTPEHNAWSQSAQKRVAELQEEISKVNVHGFGVLIDQSSLASGNVGLSHEVDGKMVPMTPDEMQAKMASGELTEDKIKDIVKAATPLIKKLGALMQTIEKEHKALHANDPAPTQEQKVAMTYVQTMLKHAVADFQTFMPGAVEEGAIGRRDPLDHYRVNVLRASDGTKGAKVIFESKPSLERLLGIVEDNKDISIVGGVALKTKSPGGPTIKGGSLLQADIIVMNVMDLLREPGAWHAVMELQRTGQIEIPEEGMLGMPVMKGNFHLEHRPKIVLIGSPYYKMLLSHYDEDFVRGFNASAEFNSELDINPDSIAGYLQFMKKTVIRSAGQVLDFNRDAIGAVLEYASYEAESNEKFSAQFAAIYNLMREATRLAGKAGRKEVAREDVQGALADRKDNTSQHQKRYMELLEKRVFVIDTIGMKYNQANGLVVMGDFGAPARVTFVQSEAEKGGGVVSNDQSAHWTGHSMDKAFANVQGYYEKTYGKDAENIRKRYSFEQTYGGLDGDSATGIKTSLGELSMAGLPIRQDGAMTGSMDQLGNIQAIGGVNYKLEGLFDLLNYRGQLVPKENIRERAFAIIPRSNVSQLTLKPEVIQAIREKRFVIYGVENVRQAEEILSYAPYSEIQRRVRAYSEHEEMLELAKQGLGKKYAEDPAALKSALAKLVKADKEWKAQMVEEAQAYRTVALTPATN